jgi:glyoxalase family protein
MQAGITGLHHVTATVDGAQEDLDFVTGLLGLRLVKQTVNFDNHNVFHFYYGTERGEPGTLWTTFPYRGWGVRKGVIGAGQVTTTAFSVPLDSLRFWRERLAEVGIKARESTTRRGEARIVFDDPSGLEISLVGTTDDKRAPWLNGEIDAMRAVRGLHSVTLTVRSAAPTVTFFQENLGFSMVDYTERVTTLAVNGDVPGHYIKVNERPEALPAVNGLGTVHHVALSIGSADEQLVLRNQLMERGFTPTEVRDRSYFTSIYFREPGGVLIEVATAGPGFATDEPVESLGTALQLPPWEETHRPTIERGLPPILVAGVGARALRARGVSSR